MKRNLPFGASSTMCKVKQRNSCARDCRTPDGRHGFSALENTVRSNKASSEKRHTSKSGSLFLRGAIQDHAYFLKRDQSAFDHLVEPRQNLLDAFGVFDDLQHDRQVLRQAKNLVGVIDARSAVAADAAPN